VGAAVLGAGVTQRVRALRGSEVPADVAMPLAVRSVVADTESVGRALRREYWPLGATALALSPWSRPARAVSSMMLVPLLVEWARGPRSLDPVRYTALRLAADVAYGSGVQAGAWRERALASLRPGLRRRESPKTAWGQRLRRLRGAVT
jgi:hypothetical protein